MAKVATPNVVTPGGDIGYGLSALLDLVLGNGYTAVSSGTGTAGARTATNQLTTPALWIAAANTWAIYTRGSIWVTLHRISATQLTVKVAVTAPSVVGSATVPDSQVTAANETTFASMSISASTRAHAISFNADNNASGVRAFYLVFTDGSAAPKGSVVLEAMADGTYPMSNPAPYVVAASASGNPFTGNTSIWAWWYSPTSTWTSGNTMGTLYTSNYISGNTVGAGVNPWSSEDQMIPPVWGRPTSGASPGLVGQAATMRSACVFRSYPSTVNLASDAYLYVGTTSGSSLIPWPNGITPL